MQWIRLCWSMLHDITTTIEYVYTIGECRLARLRDDLNIGPSGDEAGNVCSSVYVCVVHMVWSIGGYSTLTYRRVLFAYQNLAMHFLYTDAACIQLRQSHREYPMLLFSLFDTLVRPCVSHPRPACGHMRVLMGGCPPRCRHTLGSIASSMCPCWRNQ